mgnify:FL=1
MLNFNYYTKINKGNISNEFKLYSFVSSFVIFLHLFIVYKYFNVEISNQKKYTLISYLLTLSNIVLIGIMTIILLYFSTDG